MPLRPVRFPAPSSVRAGRGRGPSSGAPPIRAGLLVLLLLAGLGATPAAAQNLPCAPCAGVRVPDAAAAAELAASLAAARQAVDGPSTPADGAASGGEAEAPAPLLVAWAVEPGALAADPGAVAAAAEASRAAAAAVTAAGGTPWITFRFRAPAPILDHVATLDAEIAAASAVVRAVAPAADDAWYQLDWRPAPATAADAPAPGSAGAAETLAPAVLAADYAYLAKRAAVAVGGAAPAGRVASRPLAADPELLTALYAEEVAGYLDAVALAFAPPERVEAAAAVLAGLDPGSPVVLDAVPFPPVAARGLALAAEYVVAGVPVTLFDTSPVGGARPGRPVRPPGADALAPFVLLAREFAGDVAYDPSSTPPGGNAWSFVRGSDLGLRVIVRPPRRGDGQPLEEEMVLTFPDSQLRSPQRVDLATGELRDLYGLRVADGVEVRLEEPGLAAVLRLERAGVEELGQGSLAEEVTVESERQVPVEEILRRLQAFEDAQERRIDHYSAVNTTHLRFGVGAGSVGSFEATFQGPFFFDEESGIDWAWETLFVNGVRWRSRRIPEIPLVQPEKAAALPGEITFDKTYRYRLRGTEVVDGREAWVVEFEPAVPVRGAAAAEAETRDAAGDEAADAAAEAPSLYRGTVWVDREVHARLRTRAVQLGLSGEVLSNEETLRYQPITATGTATGWTDPEAFVLPLHLVAQQLLSVVNATTLVERETKLSAVRINGEDFATRRAEVMASDVTMVRDTAEGLRYLVKTEDGEGRVVKEGYDTSKWFVVGGLFWDDSLDYPLPLGGINYLDLDFRDSGTQVNVFFAGALLAANAAQPRLFGSRFDAGVDLFGIAVPLADSVYRDGEEIEDEEVEMRPLTAAVKIGRPVGSFVKLGAEYRLRHRDYGATDETADGFAVPSDHLEQEVELSARFSRFGYSLTAEGAFARRSEWEPWGFAGNPEYDPEHEDYLTWGATLAKSWYLQRFQKIGAELVYVDGEDLDRFSKYEFGFFGDTRVAGYRSSRVKADSAYLARASYGFEVGELLRLDAQVDTAWATDELAGLEDEFLAGVGIAGTFIGPWQTLINLDIGTPLAGPDDGVVAYVVFLKLFD